jgi:hypothetical protein
LWNLAKETVLKLRLKTSQFPCAYKKGSDLVDKINEILEGVSKEDRQELMDWAIENQPLSE